MTTATETVNRMISIQENTIGSEILTKDFAIKAIPHFRKAVNLWPDNIPAWENIALCLLKLGKTKEGTDLLESLLRNNPDIPFTQFNLGGAYLSQGLWEKGWPGYEKRWEAYGNKRPVLDHPEWDGTPLEKKRLLVRGEQGYGDAINFGHLINLIDGNVIFQVHDRLIPLFTTMEKKNIHIVSDKVTVKASEYDVWAPMMSLPRLLKINKPEDLPKFPTQFLYYAAMKSKDSIFWDSYRKIKTRNEIKLVGIAWRGNVEYGADHEKRIPQEMFSFLVDRKNTEVWSFQRDEKVIPELNNKIIDHHKHSSLRDGFVDTILAMWHMDYVVTADTMIAHLAGALRIPTFLALPFYPDWRWGLTKNSVPWYPNTLLIRQTKPGKWDDVFEKIANLYDTKFNSE